jgi:hypothetical protein
VHVLHAFIQISRISIVDPTWTAHIALDTIVDLMMEEY